MTQENEPLKRWKVYFCRHKSEHCLQPTTPSIYCAIEEDSKGDFIQVSDIEKVFENRINSVPIELYTSTFDMDSWDKCVKQLRKEILGGVEE